MNERLRELYQQAVMYGFDNRFKETPELGEQPLQEVFIEKFAELIVKECMGICGKDSLDYRYIKEHFGVKE